MKVVMDSLVSASQRTIQGERLPETEIFKI